MKLILAFHSHARYSNSVSDPIAIPDDTENGRIVENWLSNFNGNYPSHDIAACIQMTSANLFLAYDFVPLKFPNLEEERGE